MDSDILTFFGVKSYETAGDDKMAEKCRRVDRKLRYQGTILNFYSDFVELPNGKVAEWDFIEHKGAAAVIPVTKEKKILMVRQYRNALDRFTLEIPAGARDYPEEPTKDCAARELEEETGYRAGKIEQLLSLRSTVAFCNELIDIYLATDLTPAKQNLDDEEDIDVVECTMEELLSMVYAGTIQDSKTVAAILAVNDKLF